MRRKTWMESFFEEVENCVLHNLHNFYPDKVLTKKLFGIESKRRIVPECLQIGRSFLTHKSIFWDNKQKR